MEVQLRSFLYGICAGSGLCAIINMVFNKQRKLVETDDCILFSPQRLTCQNNCLKCKFWSCSSCNYIKLLNSIQETRTHLDICVYLITFKDLTDLIIRLFKNGVCVRIITDKQMSEEANKSKVIIFFKEHIPIKFMRSSEMMHNKFVIIDKKKVITGSFNWTRQALNSNFENGVIIHNTNIVRKFNDYFEDMWSSPSIFG